MYSHYVVIYYTKGSDCVAVVLSVHVNTHTHFHLEIIDILLLYAYTVTLAPAITSLTISSSNNFTVRSDTTKLFFVHNDTKLMLNCVAEGDTDEIMYSWYKDDTILNNDRVSVLDNGSLLINATDYRHDDGEYYCEAIDRYGDNVTSDSVELSIACELS